MPAAVVIARNEKVYSLCKEYILELGISTILFYPGVGHMFVGRVKRGVVLLLGFGWLGGM
jgi:hypothetical protein